MNSRIMNSVNTCKKEQFCELITRNILISATYFHYNRI